MKLPKLFSFLLLSIPLTASAFTDVSVDHANYQAIEYLKNKGTIQGYEDQSFKPDTTINRAEFLKIVLQSYYPQTNFSVPTEPCFTDVPTDSWFAPYVCQAKSLQIISGYPDGTFQPSKPISLVEVAKITISSAKTVSGSSTETAAPTTPWYEPYINALDEYQAIPPSIQYFNQNLTRSEIAEVIWRLFENPQNQPHTSVSELTFKPQCQPLGENLPSNIDPERIRQTWLQWMNTERANLGLHPYTYNSQLSRTATNWSNVSAARGYMDHKRPGTTAYYDYNAITAWYRNLGLEFANINRVTHSENIGWDVYRCSETAEDCTDHAISKLRNVFDFYMREKGQAYSPHYDSMTNRYFNEIGLGIAISGGKIYYTTHYGTQITSDPMPVCES